jgi:polyhydroxyalkanoate synthesis regulator phasin
MRGTKTRFAALAVAAALVAGIAVGSATARPGGHRHQGSFMQAAARYIGITPAAIFKEARAGKSLGEIATAHGKTVAGLESALLTALKGRLDEAVAKGKLTPAQERKLLDGAPKMIDRIVNAKPRGRPGGPKSGKTAAPRFLRAAADYIGITTDALVKELKGGKSLAQVATAHGKTASGLRDELLKPFKAKLDKAVKAGRISADQAKMRLAQASAMLDKLISRAHKKR